jgi:hypothetical protein
MWKNIRNSVLATLAGAVLLVGIGFLTFAYYPTKCIILGSNICNYYEVERILNEFSPRNDALFDRVMELCGRMHRSPKMSKCYERLVGFGDDQMNQACSKIEYKYVFERSACGLRDARAILANTPIVDGALFIELKNRCAKLRDDYVCYYELAMKLRDERSIEVCRLLSEHTANYSKKQCLTDIGSI